MKAVSRTIILALAVMATSSCSSDPMFPYVVEPPVVPAAGHVEVRFRNATDFALTDVSLAWPGGSMQVSQLAPGAVSAYEQHDGAYRYGALQVKGGGIVRKLQPIGFVGEQALAAGRYTYVIIPSTYLPDGIDLRLEIAN
jgi:hypothetical protein